MGLELDDKEFLFIYNSKKMQDRKAAAYMQTLDIEINKRDVNKDMLTETQLIKAIEKLDVSLSDMLDADKKDTDYNENDLLKLLVKDPESLKTPFVLSRKKSFFIDSPLSLIKEQFKINNHDS